MKRKIAVIEIAEILYRWNLGMSKRQISYSLGASRNTVKSIIKSAEDLGLVRGEAANVKIDDVARNITMLRRDNQGNLKVVQTKLEKWHEQLKIWRSQPNMTVTQMKRLLAEQGEIVSDTGLRRYIKKFFPEIDKTVTIHLETSPAKQAQVDYGYIGMLLDPVSKRLRKSYAFIMTLAHSRHRFVYFVFKQDVASWIDCHVRAFNFFGGIPETVLLDNLKAGVIKPHIYDPTINRSYAELERHYGFIVDPAKVRKPEHKGKVERTVTIVKQQVIAGREHQDICAANAYVRHWCLEEIAHRIVRTTGEAPWVRYTRDEKPLLLPLPKTEFERAIWQEGFVHKDHNVVFAGSFYSVPTKYIEQTVWLRVTMRTVQIYHNELLIKTHVRASNKGQWLTDPKDYPEYVSEFLEKTPQACLGMAQAMGDSIYKLVDEILQKPSITNQRKAQAVLRLSNKYDTNK
ncbi:MAG: IS21 family transposase [Pedobacter sp.]|jgi:DNA-binding Lrp family transcriptional regulator|uniref:IS21 family transposase n=1 Tax=Pedobacter sp. TaxID=1411316 RepID=UPI00356B4A37